MDPPILLMRPFHQNLAVAQDLTIEHERSILNRVAAFFLAFVVIVLFIMWIICRVYLKHNNPKKWLQDPEAAAVRHHAIVLAARHQALAEIRLLEAKAKMRRQEEEERGRAATGQTEGSGSGSGSAQRGGEGQEQPQGQGQAHRNQTQEQLQITDLPPYEATNPPTYATLDENSAIPLQPPPQSHQHRNVAGSLTLQPYTNTNESPTVPATAARGQTDQSTISRPGRVADWWF